MPTICKLKEIDGAMWARLDIDWDGGPVSLYTEIEIVQLKKKMIDEAIYFLKNFNKLYVGDE